MNNEYTNIKAGTNIKIPKYVKDIPGIFSMADKAMIEYSIYILFKISYIFYEDLYFYNILKNQLRKYQVFLHLVEIFHRPTQHHLRNNQNILDFNSSDRTGLSARSL